MLRLAAICDVSDAVRDAVVRVHDKAGRHIRKVQLIFYMCSKFKMILLALYAISNSATEEGRPAEHNKKITKFICMFLVFYLAWNQY
jgi:hypothetical protein